MVVIHSTSVRPLSPTVLYIELLITSIQATSNELRSQITTLQTALAQAREEFAARKAHEAEVTSQFQVGPLLG